MTARLSRASCRRYTPGYKRVAAVLFMTAIPAGPAAAQSASPYPPVTDTRPPGGLEQVIHKGVIGNVLEVVPLEAEDRVQLQRSGAIVNNTLLGHSVAVLLGVATAPLTAVGLILGLWSASKINGVPTAGAPVTSLTPEPGTQTAAR